MRYRVDRRELSEFVARQVELVESVPLRADLAALVGAEDGGSLQAVWLAAGLATFLGQAIVDEPERFIVEVPALGAVA